MNSYFFVILAAALGYQAASLADTAVVIHPTHLKTQAGSRLQSTEYETKVNQTAEGKDANVTTGGKQQEEA